MFYKNILLASALISILLLNAYGNDEVVNKKQVTINAETISTGVVIGQELAAFTIKDQFDKEHSLTKDTKKVIFAFSNTAGQLIKGYMSSRELTYLTSRDIIYIADISGMPSLIAKMFAIPSMKDDKYPILLIKEKENAIRFRNEEQKEAIMIISLDNKIVKSVKFVTNEINLKAELE
jgi:hypothetical protein